jgi:hypothetical protein
MDGTALEEREECAGAPRITPLGQLIDGPLKRDAALVDRRPGLMGRESRGPSPSGGTRAKFIRPAELVMEGFELVGLL